MFVHRSNRIERLVDALAGVVQEVLPGADPFALAMAPETIVVQGGGMARWLSMELARRFGVWANPSFPFPRTIIERALDAVVPDEDERLEFSAESLQWSVAAALPELLDQPGFEPLAGYVADDSLGVRRLQLSERIGDVFDRYAVYRPAMVLDWDRGRDSAAGAQAWQPVLWRAVTRSHRPHMASRVARFLEALAGGVGPIPGLPARICLFGLSTLPPLYLDVLDGLAKRIPVHLFLLAPSDQYFADLRSDRERARAGERAEAEGHPLLASLGRVAREFQQVLEDRVDYREGSAVFEAPDDTTLLGRLQADLLRVDRGEAPAELDDSIQIHSCHGPMREVQVLHDRLLDAFTRDESLRPRDVIVMAPDIERYTPYVEAVFGAGEGAVPYRIADRSVRSAYGVVDAFLRVLAAVTSRLAAPAVVDLLNFSVVRDRFDIEPEEIETIRGWVDQSGVRWGEDAAHRAEVGQPGYGEHTWRFGLDRLLLGYAMADDGLWHGVLPHGEAEGSAGDLVGRLADLMETLFRLRARLAAPRPVGEWGEVLLAAFEAVVLVDDAQEYQAGQVRDALADLGRRASEAGFEDPVDLAAVIGQLERYFKRQTTVGSFLTGGVTFCAMVPMRTIPFRLVALLGLDHDAFPRSERPPGFSLVHSAPRPGDRSPREDDRYLFLEALLAARDGVILSYVGQGIQDNRMRPPSVLVDELLDEIERMAHDETDRVREALTVVHPIQPFSVRYFREGSPLFSYSERAAAGARALAGERELTPAFVGTALPGEELDTVALGELVRFFKDPARTFAQRRLGLFLGSDEVVLSDREPIELDNLEKWSLGDPLVRALVEGRSVEDTLERLRAAGRVPPGHLADYEIEGILPAARDIAETVAPLLAANPLPPADLEVDVAGVRVSGRFDDLRPTGLVRYLYSQATAKKALDLWIRHLFLCAAGAPDVQHRATLVARGKKGGTVQVTLRAPADARAELAHLVALYRAGLSRPVPLFRESSWTYVEKLRAGQDPEVALERARDEYGNKDAGDAYVGQIFGPELPAGGSDPLGFEAVARTVYEPLMDHQEGL